MKWGRMLTAGVLLAGLAIAVWWSNRQEKAKEGQPAADAPPVESPPAVPSRAPVHRDVADERVGDAGGRAPVRHDRPGDDGDRSAAPALAGVEAAVAGEAGVEGEPHEPGLTLGEEVAEVGTDLACAAVGQDRREAAAPLVDQQGAVRRLRDVPRMVQPVEDHLDLQRGRARRRRGGRRAPGGTGRLGSRARACSEQQHGRHAGPRRGAHGTQHALSWCA